MALIETASDTFQRADANPLSGNWASVGNDGIHFAPNQLVSHAVEATSIADIECASFYTGVSAAPNQYAQIVIGSAASGLEDNPAFGVVVRASAGGTCYLCAIQDEGDGTIAYEIERWDSFEFTFLAEGYFAGAVSSGDTVLAAIIDGDISLSYNNKVIASVSDPSPIPSGQFGIEQASFSNLTDGTISAWSAGSATAGWLAALAASTTPTLVSAGADSTPLLACNGAGVAGNEDSMALQPLAVAAPFYLFPGNTVPILWSLIDGSTEFTTKTPVTDATGTLTVYDPRGNVVAGADHLEFSETDTPGVYSVLIDGGDFNPPVGTGYYTQIEMTSTSVGGPGLWTVDTVIQWRKTP